jgi:uncharacterized membrane protein YsdA (DUF1294 family)
MMRWVLVGYGVVSVVAFLVYGFDKRRARKGGRRVPERTLHLVELCGGWPGAFAAQRVFRHKTRKRSFQLLFWAIVLLHVAFWIWWLRGR